MRPRTRLRLRTRCRAWSRTSHGTWALSGSSSAGGRDPWTVAAGRLAPGHQRGALCQAPTAPPPRYQSPRWRAARRPPRRRPPRRARRRRDEVGLGMQRREPRVLQRVAHAQLAAGDRVGQRVLDVLPQRGRVPHLAELQQPHCELAHLDLQVGIQPRHLPKIATTTERRGRLLHDLLRHARLRGRRGPGRPPPSGPCGRRGRRP